MKRIVLAAVLTLGGAGMAAAGPMPVSAQPPSGAAPIEPVQYYGYPAYRRPYGYGPYGYGPGPRYYANHFGPGAAKERYIRRQNYCRNRPERCR